MADISMDFEVAAVPTFLFFKSGKLLKRIEGAKADDVTKAVKSLASQKSSGSARPPANKTEEERIMIAGNIIHEYGIFHKDGKELMETKNVT